MKYGRNLVVREQPWSHADKRHEAIHNWNNQPLHGALSCTKNPLFRASGCGMAAMLVLSRRGVGVAVGRSFELQEFCYVDDTNTELLLLLRNYYYIEID